MRILIASVMIGFLLFTICLSEANAQLDTIHWLPPLHSKQDVRIDDHYVYLSTPVTNSFQVTVTDGSGTPISGSPFTISNSNPVRINIGSGQNPATKLMVPFNSLNKKLDNSGLILRASERFYANARYQTTHQGGSVTAKGRAAKGQTFRVGSMPQPNGSAKRNFVMSVFATEDNTNITISDYDPGVVFDGPTPITSNTVNLTLDAGQTYVLSGYTNTSANLEGFVGALVESDQPIIVNTGNWLGTIANPPDKQDIGIDQIVPVETVGQDYISIEAEGRPVQERPMVVAHSDNTEVYVNGGGTPVATLQAGEWHLIDNANYAGASHKNMFIHTSKPAYVYQFLAGSTNRATPGMNFLPPLNCALPSEVDLIPSISQIGNTSYNGDIIALTEAGATLQVNGTTQTGAEPVAGNPDWVTYKISAFTGDVTITSTGPMAAGMYGSSGDAGYGGYFSGFSQSFKAGFEVASNTTCMGDTLQMAFTGDSTVSTIYNWDFQPANIVSGNGPGPYQVTYDTSGTFPIQLVVSQGNCRDTLLKTVKVQRSPTLTDSVVDVECHGENSGKVLLSVNNSSGQELYSWNNGANTQDITSVSAGAYTVTVSDTTGCDMIHEARVSEPSALTIESRVEQGITCDSLDNGIVSASGEGGTSPYSYYWSTGDTLANTEQTSSMIQNLPAGTYSTTVVDDNGCMETDTVSISSCKEKHLYIPNAFSPNGQEPNEEFRVYAEGVREFEMMIFDRWGELIFKTQDIDEGWDGTYKGRKLNPGVFVYVITVTFIDDEEVFRKGSVTLLR